MWAFRKRPADLSEEEQAKLETLFEQIPGLELPYHCERYIRGVLVLCLE